MNKPLEITTIAHLLCWIFIGVCLPSTSLLAQNPYYNIERDFGIWSSIELDQKHNKRWKSSYNLSYRIRENATEFRNAFFEYAINRDLKNKFDAGVQFRFSASQGPDYGFRWSPYLTKSWRLKPVTFKYRFKNDMDIPLLQNSEFDYRLRVRNRLQMKYERKKYPVSVGIGAEWFHEYDASSFLLSNIRISSGIEYELNKKTSIGIGYFVQQEHNVVKPERDYVVTCNVSYKL